MTLKVKPQLCADSLSRKSVSRRSGLIVILDFCTPCNVRQITRNGWENQTQLLQQMLEPSRRSKEQ